MKGQCIEQLLIIESEYRNRIHLQSWNWNKLHKQKQMSNHAIEEFFVSSSWKRALKTDYYLVFLPINIQTPMPVDFPHNLLVVYNSKKEVTRPPHSKYIYMVSTCFQLLQSRTYLAPKLLAQHKELKALEWWWKYHQHMPSTKEVLQSWAVPVSCFNVDNSKINLLATAVAHHYSSEQKNCQTCNIHSPWNIKNIINKSKKNHKTDWCQCCIIFNKPLQQETTKAAVKHVSGHKT